MSKDIIIILSTSEYQLGHLILGSIAFYFLSKLSLKTYL